MFSSVAPVSTDYPCSDTLLHVIDLERYSEIMISLNMHAVNLINSGKKP
jgi:hypothetical protein